MSHDRGCHCGNEFAAEYRNCKEPRCTRRDRFQTQAFEGARKQSHIQLDTFSTATARRRNMTEMG